MDFQSLSRRELQVLCKKNKIPANLTNVAMADSLKALENVEGIDELLQMCESERGERLEVASPFVPPTGGRSTRRRNAETPAAPQTNSRKGQTENNDAFLSAAPSGVTSRRRIVAKEDTAFKQVRRSARLAEKSGRLLKGAGNEDPDFSKKGLFAEECDETEVNLKESQDEISGLTDASESINLEDKSDRKDGDQVDSAEKQDIATEVDLLKNNHSEADDGINEVEAITIMVEDEGRVLVLEEAGDGSVAAQASETDIQVKITQEDQTNTDVEDKGILENEGTFDVEASKADILTEEDITNANADTESENKAVLETKASDAKLNSKIPLASNDPIEAAAVENRLPIIMKNFSPQTPPSYSTPARGSARKNRVVMSAASDNKENIGTETKTRNKMFKEITQSICNKELKEQVYNTPRLDKKEGGDEVSATARPALQLLPDNQQE